MSQSELNRAVARATGETIDRITRMGFSVTVVPERLPSAPRSRRRRPRRRKPATPMS